MAKMFIAGESTGSSSGQTYNVINPATGELWILHQRERKATFGLLSMRRTPRFPPGPKRLRKRERNSL